MMGSAESPGIIPKICKEIFDAVNAKLENTRDDDGKLQCLITVSYLEIYNETINDLLNPSDKQLKIHEHPEHGVYVKDLCELVSDNPRVSDVCRFLMSSFQFLSRSCTTLTTLCV